MADDVQPAGAMRGAGVRPSCFHRSDRHRLGSYPTPLDVGDAHRVEHRLHAQALFE
jgi:hypothetical protein